MLAPSQPPGPNLISVAPKFIYVNIDISYLPKGTDADIVTDMTERDRMAEIACIEVEGMLRSRKMKKESKANDDIIVSQEHQEPTGVIDQKSLPIPTTNDSSSLNVTV